MTSIKPLHFYNELIDKGISFFTGVPDSLLKEFCLCLDDFIPKERHIIAANEGSAIALAAGHYLAKKTIPLVYMQNSGLGNAINPILSLCDPEVYSIPMLLMIGWRGEPGVKDEPQHIKQGKIQLDLLETMDIPYEIISPNTKKVGQKIKNCFNKAKEQSRPTALLVRKGTFEKYTNNDKVLKGLDMAREDALKIILDKIDKKTIIVSTTGKTSREIFEIREQNEENHNQDFLTVGSMGHSASIALGIALSKPNRKVLCIDGDGSMIMHLGSLTNMSNLKPKNFCHIVLNNEAHESVGGQQTAAKNINLASIAKKCGYNKIFIASSKTELKKYIDSFLKSEKPSFFEVKIKLGSRKDLGRPKIKPIDNKQNFMKFLND